MRLKSIILTGIAAILITLPACKDKEEETTTKEYLTGSLSFTVPAYVQKGEVYSLTPSGVKNPGTGESSDVGYYWTTSWESSKKDTTKTEADKAGDGTYKLTIPSKVGSFTVSCVAFATGYYTTSNTASFSVVDPALDSTIAGAYTGKEWIFTDPRDGNKYYTTTLDGKIWMKNNLFYSKSGVSYESSKAIDAVLGRFYTWSEAVSACPDGWHLPSEAEFTALANSVAPEGKTFSEKESFIGVAGSLMVDAKFLGTRMWEYWPQVKITNKAGFSALPAGYAVDSDGITKFTGVDNYATFWTSGSESEDTGFCRYIYVKQNDVLVGARDKESFRASVRCVKD